MKVLMIGNHSSVHGGITSVIQQILRHDWKSYNINMKFLPTYKGGNPAQKLLYFMNAVVKFKKIIKNDKPDVVHIHMSHHGSFTRANYIQKLCLKHHIPDVIHLHGSEFASFYQECSHKKQACICRFFDDCSEIIVLGDYWKQFISSISKNKNITVLNNSVFIPSKTVEQSENDLNVLFLGVLFKRKGVADLLKTIKNLDDLGQLTNKKIIFNIGGSGPEEDSLKEYVRQNKLEQYVRFLGWVEGEQKKKLLASNQVFVLPSYNEGLPIAILEALSYGMPIVATNVGSVKEAVHDGVNGYLVKPGDIDGYVKAFSELICHFDVRCRMAEASKKMAENCFNEEIYFRKINDIYQKCL